MDGNQDVCVCFFSSVLKNELKKITQYRKMSKKKNIAAQNPNFFKDLKVK